MAPPVRLVVGLGNPGPEYTYTRHNAGFWFVDALSDRAGEDFRVAARFFGAVCEIRGEGHLIRLLKPGTFMNRSGQAVAAIARFYRHAPEEILVAHDDIDLPPGTVRLKRGGGHGGHNGLRDIVASLGANGFNRLRIGVGHPGHSDAVMDYVLTRPRAGEQQDIVEAIDRALEVMPLVFTGQMEAAMNELHRKPQVASTDPPPAKGGGDAD